MSFIRGFNPIWFEVDLAAEPFDDTFYLFVLQNTFPYLPAVVYHDSSGTIRNNPIQFLANGTLPVDIFFDTGSEDDPAIYRLEFRHGQTQSDPLIYLVEDYIPGNDSTTPIDTVALISDNQITNAQFSLVNFSTPYQITSGSTQSIEVAPGWFLDLTGTGNATITQVPLNNSAQTENPTNAPYALEINISGTWSNAILRQRFDVNGMLWANKTVSSSVTARIEGASQTIRGILVDSNGTTLVEVLDSKTVDSEFTEYQGYGTLPATTNPDLPPAAYIEYQIILPTSVDIFITSLQLVVSNIQTRVPYVQDSIQRQQDYTWHYYRESVIMQPKDSLLTGWDFALNPWQFTSFSSTTVSSQCAYTADQTIIYQQAGGSEVAVGMAPADDKYAYEVTAIGNNSRFAIIQYIDPATVGDIWGEVLSSLVRARISSPTHGTAVRFKMRLIWRTTLPSTIGAAQPISSWSGSGDPSFAAGWTAVAPRNDPVYTFGSAVQNFPFEGMSLATVVPSTDTMTLGIVLYTLDPIIETATADRILFERISLVPNDFAIDSSILTFDEVFRQCQFYFESSKNTYLLPTDSSAAGSLVANCHAAQSGLNIALFPRSFDLRYKQNKRSGSVTLNVYTAGGALGNCDIKIRDGGAQIAASTISFTTGWNAQEGGNSGTKFVTVAPSNIFTFGGTVTNTTDGFISFHYTADARLGV